jgi:outer membrane protease
MIPRAAGLLFLLATPAAAQQAQFTVGPGVINLHANEIVYAGDRRLSQLVWSTAWAPILSAGLMVETPEGWLLSVDADVAGLGDSQMADYDWLEPFAPGQDWDDWSDRSLHSDTGLDVYVAGRAALARRLALLGPLTLNAGAGVRYTAVKWTARGGSYVYSEAGFREDVGSFDAGEPIISYEQRWPVGFLSVEGEVVSGSWTLAGLAEAGLAVGAQDIDDHWLRDLRFYDYFDLAPVITLGARGTYAATDRLALTAGASFQQVFTVRGDSVEIDGNDRVENPDSAGADFRAVTVTLGVTGRF